MAGAEVVLQQRCAECHDDAAKKGGLDLEAALRAEPAARLTAIARVRDRVRASEMPPSDAEPMQLAERMALLRACDEVLAAEVPRLRPSPGRVTVRRLSRSQWEHCVLDLFGVSTARTSAFPADDLAYGFDTIGDALSFSTLHLEAYLAAAEDVAAQVFDGDDGAPVRRLIEAESMELVRGHGLGADGDVAVLISNATLGAEFDLSRGGTVRISVLCGASRAGDEPARMVVAVDGRELASIEVLQRELKDESITLPIGAGAHRIEVAFVNDLWDRDNPDPNLRDRNLYVDRVVVEGPMEPRVRPPQQQILLGLLDRPFEEAARAMAPLAFRAAPTKDSVRPLVAVAERRMTAGGARHEALRDMLTTALASPRFLFRIEPPSAKSKAGSVEPLSPEAIASRLSFFLWSSAPDSALLAAAQKGLLSTPRGVREEAIRMLADPRADRIASDFAEQWFELRALELRTPDPASFPGFDDALRRSMRRETELLFQAVLREGRDVRALLDADFTHVDATLARFYGFEGDFGDAFVRVPLRGEQRTRRGVLGHASWLAVTSNPTRTSPVKRGKWVMENLLDQAPPPPPPGNAIFVDERTVATPQGLREQLAAHRARSACAGCHERMDAFGLVLEQFDAVGRFRSHVADAPIDVSSTLPSGTVLEGIEGLRASLREDPAFPRTVLRKLFVYAVGRDVTPAERLILDLAVDRLSLLGSVRIEDLIGVVVESEAFRMREVVR